MRAGCPIPRPPLASVSPTPHPASPTRPQGPWVRCQEPVAKNARGTGSTRISQAVSEGRPRELRQRSPRAAVAESGAKRLARRRPGPTPRASWSGHPRSESRAPRAYGAEVRPEAGSSSRSVGGGLWGPSALRERPASSPQRAPAGNCSPGKIARFRGVLETGSWSRFLGVPSALRGTVGPCTELEKPVQQEAAAGTPPPAPRASPDPRGHLCGRPAG